MTMITFDDLEDLPTSSGSAVNREEQIRQTVEATATLQSFTEPCRKCRGSGRFISYSGRDLGPCFKCKGAGKVSFATPPDARAKARETSATRKAERKVEAMEAFKAEHGPEAAWMIERATRFDFARAMVEAIEKFGSLTVNQMAAVHRCMEKDAARSAERTEKRAATSAEIDISKLDAAFAIARESGAVKAAIRTGSIVFSLASATGKNPGAIYCKTRSEGTYLGKIVSGRFSSSMECTPAHTAEIVEAAADPKAAALRYASLTNECSVCGKLLTNPVSKANGIGPVCASKFGW